MKQIMVRIDGMMCGMCEAHICDALRRALTVKKVSASHRKGQAVILTEDDIPEQAIRDAIEATGYLVLSVTSQSYDRKGLFAARRK